MERDVELLISRKRIFAVFVVTAVLFLLLIARLFYLSVFYTLPEELPQDRTPPFEIQPYDLPPYEGDFVPVGGLWAKG